MKLRSLSFALIALITLGTACGDDKEGVAIDAAVTIDTPSIDAPLIDAPDYTNGDIELRSANSLYWDAATSALYLTSSQMDKLIKYDDVNHFTDRATLPAPTGMAAISLGDIAKDGDGFLVANFGFGTDGALFAVPATGDSARITGLDTARRRIGLSRAPNGDLYTVYFTGNGMNAVGGVAKVTITAGVGVETVLATQDENTVPFKKLVGLVATNDFLYVGQQANPKAMNAGNFIYKIATATGAVTTIATNFAGSDCMIGLPNGDLLISGISGIHRVTPTGTVTALDLGATFEELHGIAYDPALHRLFFLEQPADQTMPEVLHIRPFTP